MSAARPVNKIHLAVHYMGSSDPSMEDPHLRISFPGSKSTYRVDSGGRTFTQIGPDGNKIATGIDKLSVSIDKVTSSTILHFIFGYSYRLRLDFLEDTNEKEYVLTYAPRGPARNNVSIVPQVYKDLADGMAALNMMANLVVMAAQTANETH